MPHMKSYTHKQKELQQRNHLETFSRKTGCVCVGGGGGGFKQVLLARNLALNSDAVPNYKYICSFCVEADLT